MKQPKLLDTFVALNVTFQLVSDVVAGKLVQFFGHTVSVSVFFFPFTFIISDILTEIYGYERAKRVIRITLISSILAGTLYQLAVLISPAPSFAQNEAYSTVFTTVPRILIAGWIAVYAGELTNNYTLARLKIITQGRHLWLRTISSTVIGQGVNTTVFYTIGLYGILPTSLLVPSILAGWIFKIMVEVLMTPLVYSTVRLVKKIEGIDAYTCTRARISL